MPNKKKPRRILTEKFFKALKELDSIKDPSNRALGRQAIYRYYGLPNRSLRFTITCWILMVVCLILSLSLWSLWKALLLTIGLLVVCTITIGFVLMQEGGLTEKGMLNLIRAGFSALVKYPQILIGGSGKDKPSE